MNLSDTLLLTSDVILVALASGVALPTVVLSTECVASLLPTPRDRTLHDAPRPRVALLVPAHNEELGIGATATALADQLRPGDRLLVVADNCTDATATIARAAGAEVLERHDAVRRGKGYALAAGLEVLATDPPDVVMFFDADVLPSPGAVATLARRSAAHRRPVQAVYLLQNQDKAPGVRATLSELAFITKNSVRPRGLHRLGLPVPLTGTGIALPWPCVRDVELASGDLVEDMKLGLDLLLRGHPPLLCPEVTLRGDLPHAVSTAQTQRTRWEHGHLLTLKRWVPALAVAGIRQRRPSLLGAALDLLVPPVALLTLVLTIVLIANASYGLVLDRWMPAAVSGLSALALFVSIAIAWASSARHLSPLMILGAPIYIVWKLPMYLRVVMGRPQTTWIRTERVS